MARNLRGLWGVLFCGTVFMFLAPVRPARAQVLYGSMVGTVTDPSGAAIPGAAVTVTEKGTGFSRHATTETDGSFSLPTIPAGTYEVKITKEGFKTFTRAEVPLTVNTVARVDATLEVGAVTQAVEVSGVAPILTTDRADVHHELMAQTLENVPLPPGRNYQQLFRTIPGFNPLQNAHSIPSNPSRSLRYNVNGTSASSNDVRVDGASQFNVWLPHVTAYVPALESIQTVNVVTGSYGVEQGLAGGSTVGVQIKSGTNAVHGAGFEYHNDNGLEALPYFGPSQGITRVPKDIFNQFGGAVGGPIKRNKLFYFGSYEGTLVSQFAQRIGTVPTMTMRTGDLTDAGVTIFDPATGNADGTGRLPISCNGVANVICSGRISSVANKLLALLPPPNIPGATLSSNYLAGASFKFNRHTVDGKIDWDTMEKLRMYGRFSYLHYTDIDPEMLGAVGGEPISSFGGNPGKGTGYTASTTIAATYLLRPNFVVDGNFGYTVMDTASVQSRLDEKLGLDFLGLPGTNGTRLFEGGWPQFDISGFSVLGVEDFFMPYFRHDPQQHWNANATWTKGPHNVRFGIDIGHLGLNHQQAEFPGALGGAQGGFQFRSGPTQLKQPNGKASPSNSFNSFASFLLGLPASRGKNFQVPDQFTTRTTEWGIFAGDQWQVSHKLTLNYGTRIEYFPIPGRADRGLERYDISNNTMLVCGVGQVPRDCGVDYSKLKLAPRIGFAYRATETFVIRAGYGITTDPYDLGRPLRTNYPTLIPLTDRSKSSFAPVGPLSDGIPPIAVPDLGNGIIPIPGNIAISTLPPKFKRGYIQSWNLTLEKEILKGWVGQAAYVATRSVNELGVLDLNVGQVGGGTPSEPFFQKFGRSAQTQMVQPVANTHYDALQTTLKHRFSRGFQVDLAYTWSKTIGIAGVGSGSDNGPRIQLPQFYFLNHGRADLDRPHNFEALLIGELPFGKGRKWASGGGLASALMGGWQLNGIFSRFSGSVFNVSTSGTSLNAPGSTQRADQIKSPVQILGGHGRGDPYFDPFAFAPVTDVRFGTASFNTLRGPGAANVDLGLFRELSLSERWKLQFRAEAFNFTNSPHFSNPGASVSSISGTFNPDGTINTINKLNGYTEITGTSSLAREGVDQRVLRFGLRLSF